MQRWLPLAVFVVILVCARIVGASTPDDIPNLQPYGALFFCGMACFGARWIWVPAVAWFISAPLTSAMNGYGWSAQILVPVAGFVILIALGRLFRGKNTGMIFAGSMLGAVAFFWVTNTLSWAFDPGYAKSLQGYIQAFTTGLPGYEPTVTFFRNSMAAQAVFTAIFLIAYDWIPLKGLGKTDLPKTQRS